MIQTSLSDICHARAMMAAAAIHVAIVGTSYLFSMCPLLLRYRRHMTGTWMQRMSSHIKFFILNF